MLVRTFTARNVAQAMSQVKKDLGPAAVILHVKEERRGGWRAIFGATQVRVTAAVDDPGAAQDGAEGASPVLAFRDALRRQLGEAAPAVKPDMAEELVAILRRSEVEEGLARRIAAAACRVEADSDAPFDHAARQAIATLFPMEGPLAPRSSGARIMAVIGPTGVGKTTTVAKLAARFCAEIGPRVVILRTDAAFDGPLDRAVAGVASDRALGPAELRRCVARHADKQLILVDTAGRSPFDRPGLSELAEMLSAVPEAETALAVSATTKLGDLLEIAEAFSVARPRRLILTKMDETRRIGPVLSLCAQYPIPLLYVTTGPRIPEDIEPADSRKLLEFILPTGGDHDVPMSPN